MESKIYKSDVYKLVPAPIDLSKLSEDEISDITNLITNTTINAKTNESKGYIPSITNLATNASLIAKTK